MIKKRRRNKKRILVQLIAILLLLFVAFTTYLRIRRQNSYKNTIHQQAEAIIKISVDDMIKTILSDAITNPSYYLKKRDKKDKKKKDKQDDGIKIPANIFIYNISSKHPSTFFCSLKISDSVNAKQFIQKKIKDLHFKNYQNKMMVATSKNNTIIVAYNHKKIAIAYSPKKEEVTDILADILTKKNMLETSSDLIKKLEKQKNHITYTRKNNKIALNFKDGIIAIDGEIAAIKNLIIPDKITHKTFSENSILKMWLQADISKKLGNKPINIKNKTLHLDSILKNYNGYLAIEWKGFIPQKDTIISYSYNDDFEKVEEKTIQEKQVPEVYISVKSNTKSLYNYLKTDFITQDTTLNKEIFPLYHTYISTTNQYFNISTSKKPVFTDENKAAKPFFSLNINFEELNNQNQLSFIQKYLQNLVQLETQAQKINNTTIELNGFLTFKNKNINAISQLTKTENEP